jgi:hypothetical protein
MRDTGVSTVLSNYLVSDIWSAGARRKRVYKFTAALVHGCIAPFKLINGCFQRVLMVFRLGCAPLITAAALVQEKNWIAFSPRSSVSAFTLCADVLSFTVASMDICMQFPAVGWLILSRYLMRVIYLHYTHTSITVYNARCAQWMRAYTISSAVPGFTLLMLPFAMRARYTLINACVWRFSYLKATHKTLSCCNEHKIAHVGFYVCGNVSAIMVHCA